MTTRHYVLNPHPTTAGQTQFDLGVLIGWLTDGRLGLTYQVKGDLNPLCIPTWCDQARADGLWRHTCLEAFIMPDAGPAYREYNFSPSGHWAAYDFEAYRQGRLDSLCSVPEISLVRTDNSLSLTARLAVPAEAGQARGRLHIGLSAMLENLDGQLGYWALAHARDQPDFHHPDTFLAILEHT